MSSVGKLGRAGRYNAGSLCSVLEHPHSMNTDNRVNDSPTADVYRIALGVEYKGSRYRGFQRQRAGVASIQESLEKALGKVAGGQPVLLSCAGRTDALVHASGQVVHFDTTVERS